ncbi:MAG TPA: HAD-IIB family hydrolase [Spirochaetota bacterium]|nr:HAD-IIB family hydrolase [Spirochaetota bacterium]HPC39564.1 HAD-IIB family hydrolase [Spirochaetota bacterium]HPL15283.1 HAD-IIB family hydrolase [Spirochaetota bacterium]HQF06901.1 HAD-IIB family hydrolase [Spirochaetota bacterium]HQH95480.1 HAD-IIB family hydrolase [Spirochaetota bacterium]
MYLVFSDLDGTILDHDTYSYEPAREGLALLKRYAVPLVLVSSKTLPEMKIIHEELGLEAPFIFENGGGIFWPEKKNPELLGADVSELREKKELLEAGIGEPVMFITDMSAEEIARRTGLSRERALLSQKRLTSLPFVIPSGKAIMPEEMESITKALAEEGLSITKGGRFYHLLPAGSDKGSAIRRIIGHYRKGEGTVTAIGIGDSENDRAMFRAVDVPVAVRKKDGTVIETGVDHVRTTSGAGPVGFTEAVKQTVIFAITQGGEQQ